MTSTLRTGVNHGSVLLLLCVSFASFAGGKTPGTKTFQEGLSDDEVRKLTKTLGAFEKKYADLKPSMDKLKANPEIPKHPPLLALASESFKHYTTIGVFLREMDDGLKKKDPKVNSFEIQLQGEVDTLELKLKALQTEAKKEHVDSVAQTAAAAIIVGAALVTAYVALDLIYDASVIDVNVVLIPTYDVYTTVHYVEPVWVDDSAAYHEGYQDGVNDGAGTTADE